MSERLFDVIPRNPWDQKNAELLAAIINRPDFVNKVTWAVQQYVNKFMLKEILYGTPIDQAEVDKFFAEIVRVPPPEEKHDDTLGR